MDIYFGEAGAPATTTAVPRTAAYGSGDPDTGGPGGATTMVTPRPWRPNTALDTPDPRWYSNGPKYAPAVDGPFRSIMTALAVIGATAVVALVWSERVGNALRLAAKPLASVCFVGVALVAGATDTAYGRWVLVALVLSAIGDVALLGRSSATFLVGLGSFLLGHVAYCVAFLARGAEPRVIVISALVTAVPGLAVVRWLWPHVPDEMRAPVAAYTVVISAMVACAVGTVVREGDVRIFAAAIGFYCSDLSVARDRFVAPGPVNRIWGLPLYYAAQFLFAWTVMV